MSPAAQLIARLVKLNLVRSAPIPERVLGGLRLVCVPRVEITFRRQELLEAGIRSSVPEDIHDRGQSLRQPLLHKSEGEMIAQVEIILVWNRDVSIGRFKILRKIFFLDRIGF